VYTRGENQVAITPIGQERLPEADQQSRDPPFHSWQDLRRLLVSVTRKGYSVIQGDNATTDGGGVGLKRGGDGRESWIGE
jgi:hypothetical protein